MFEIGSSLRDARVRHGLDLLEVEAATKIRAKYLRALEDEHFELLPGDAYVKGFLRTYADRLGLDGQLYVDEYNSRFSLAEEPVFATRQRHRSRHRRVESHAVLIALAGIVAVTVLVIAAWQLGDSDATGPFTQPSEIAGSSAVESVAEPPPVTTTVAEPAPQVELVVTAARGSSVAEVRRGSSSGELLFEGTIEQGESQPFQAPKKLWLKLSKPQNLEFELNGTRVEYVAASGPSLVVVTADGVRPVESP